MLPESSIFALILGLAAALGPAPHQTDEDSMLSALNAVTRKQRSLDHNPQEFYDNLRSLKYRDGVAERKLQRDLSDDQDDLEFLPLENGQLETVGDGFEKMMPSNHWGDKSSDRNAKNKLLERALIDYLENLGNQDESIPLPLRERERSENYKRDADDDRRMNDKQLMKMILEEVQEESPYRRVVLEDDGGLEMIPSLDVPDNKPYRGSIPSGLMSWGDAMDGQEILKDRNREEDQNEASDREQNVLYLEPAERRNINARYPLGRDYETYRDLAKRFPVAKRSPKPLQSKKQTDPKVAQDLGALFGTETTKNHSESQEHDHGHEGDHNRTQTNAQDHDHAHRHDQTSESPNETTPAKGQKDVTTSPKPKERSIKVQKKSVDWSQYFGIDRRKKKAALLARPGTQNQDYEWLLQRYYKTMAENLKTPEATDEKDGSEKRDKLQQMDDRLKNIKNLMIDEALKYTGSEDNTDSQEVKDKIMARLAAAYSLEKMIRALNELRNNVVAQRESQKAEATQNNLTSDQQNGNEGRNEDKRGNKDLVEAEEDPDELRRNCPEVEVIERRCKALEYFSGDRSQVLFIPCVLHQICRACVDESECISSFAAETAKICAAKDAAEGRESGEWCGRTAMVMSHLTQVPSASLCHAGNNCLRRFRYSHHYLHYPTYKSRNHNDYDVAIPTRR
ncbi:uncharacterized protein LOC105696547 [Orussus abietinus]|uniref:uncharacterized protein LOC105696547 n=1 Tax=Orussus abietinus TaxID=222816 RepID=UPI000626627B|nr:uncharacterized protein LOC105696547 [Orussus abietinus]XP_012274532.1 uncharacterized protein LOC105696547 [Orussus abietinus]